MWRGVQGCAQLVSGRRERAPCKHVGSARDAELRNGLVLALAREQQRRPAVVVGVVDPPESLQDRSSRLDPPESLGAAALGAGPPPIEAERRFDGDLGPFTYGEFAAYYSPEELAARWATATAAPASRSARALSATRSAAAACARRRSSSGSTARAVGL